MNLQQLRMVRETVRQGFNLTEVGNALFTSQSGVSKHIKDLEEELGLAIFVRKGKRLLGLTPPGEELIVFVERVLHDLRSIKVMAEHYREKDAGELRVVATHTQARYALPPVVAEFRKAFPKVHLKLHQGSPQEIVAMLLAGEADIGLATEAIADVEAIASFPFYRWHHALVVPQGHPLLNEGSLTLEAIARWPIITYHEGFTGRARIDETFRQAGLIPDIVISALDADVIKTYVGLGLGVGIMASMAFHDGHEKGLHKIETGALFPENTTYMGTPKGRYLRGYACRFMTLCAPELTEQTIREATASQ
jgi:LysR family transcriptional regulator, cys regulon transcriptional activator